MTACPCCGYNEESEARYSRGPLTVTINPPAIFWRGKRIKTPPSHARIIYPLMPRGRASHAAMAMLLGMDTDQEAVKTHICGLRKIIAAEGLPIAFRAIHGWGYEIEILEEEV